MVSLFHLWQKSKLKYVQHNRGIIAIHALFFFSMNYSHADASDGKRATLGVHYWNSPYQARGIKVKPYVERKAVRFCAMRTSRPRNGATCT